MIVSNAASDRFPPWLLWATLLFFLFIVAGLLVIVFRDLPAPVKPEVVEEQFADHLAFMKALAFDYPHLGTPSIPDPSSGADESAWKENFKVWKAWSKRAESRPDLLSHPAILGASVQILDAWGGTMVRITLKKAEGLESTWMESFLGFLGKESVKPEVDRPVVLYRRTGNKDLALYENRFLDPEGVEMGCRLLLDMKHLGQSPSPSPD